MHQVAALQSCAASIPSMIDAIRRLEPYRAGIALAGEPHSQRWKNSQG
jgi:hypothetical protein